jgi:uncharacterized protein YdhG (YjbR/CyaY superfamily)
MTHYSTIDTYINDQPTEVAQRLRDIRALFHTLLPDTQESIRYDIPAFTVGSEHLYISAYKQHIGMYPMYGMPELDEAILPYRGKGTKDALHFKHAEPLPLALIEKIIRTKATK